MVTLKTENNNYNLMGLKSPLIAAHSLVHIDIMHLAVAADLSAAHQQHTAQRILLD